MPRIKLTLSYDGANYCGWQIQPNGVAIQTLVQAAISKMTNEENILVGASRTDAGVHALSQVAHFDTNSKIPCEGFKKSLNSILPQDICVIDAEKVDSNFHSQRDAKGKTYCYKILISSERRPLLLNRCWQMNTMPDLKLMKRAAKLLVGERDFAGFRASGCGSRDAIRRIEKIDIKISPNCCWSVGATGRSPLQIDFTFTGNGFVRHMIRNIVGTLVDIGLGKLDKSAMKEILKTKDRKKAGKCAPACGLYLVRVHYL